MPYVGLIQCKGICAPYGLYGIGENTQLVTIDPITANLSSIGPAYPYYAEGAGLVAMDDQNEIMYLVSLKPIGSNI
jgi:hypothetical protein